MSVLQNEIILETILDEVAEDYPNLSEENQATVARLRFEMMQ